MACSYLLSAEGRSGQIQSEIPPGAPRLDKLRTVNLGGPEAEIAIEKGHRLVVSRSGRFHSAPHAPLGAEPSQAGVGHPCTGRDLFGK